MQNGQTDVLSLGEKIKQIRIAKGVHRLNFFTSRNAVNFMPHLRHMPAKVV